jgi:hypothetical protein
MEDWTKGTGTAPVRGLIWFTDGSKMKEETTACIDGHCGRRRLPFSLGRYDTVF